MNLNAEAEPCTVTDTASPLLEFVADSISVLAEHESQAISDLWQSVETRVAVARKARNIGELIRNQVDLLSDTCSRIEQHHQIRVALFSGLQSDLRRVTGRE